MTGIEHGALPRLDAILARAAQSEPRRVAVVHNGQRRTYSEVYDRASRVAAALAVQGVRKGDRVALWTVNCPEFVEIFFGVPMLGAIASPLDFWWQWKDAVVALTQLRPKVLIVGAEQGVVAAHAPAPLQQIGIEQVICLGELPAHSGFTSYSSMLENAPRWRWNQSVEVGTSDPAVILFTSGSTGRSKGAVHTHGSLTATATTMSIELGLVDGERTLSFLPMFSSCLEHLLPLTLMRATHVLLSHFDAAAVWAAIGQWKVTHIDAVPTTLRRLIEAAPVEIPASLRMISYASERMPESLIGALMGRMPKVKFVQFYGMIEHLCLTVLSANDHVRKPGTVGRPMMGTRLYLDRSATESERVGEIMVHSQSMFAGYWRDKGATDLVIKGSWMRTGDLGYFDDDGYLNLEGRIKEIIKSGGVTVIPGEVEAVLLTHPEVVDVTVIGVPDQQWGEAVHALVTPTDGASVREPELMAFCRARLIGYQRPKAIHIVSELPRTGIGKVARKLVREQVLAAGDSQGV